MNYTHSEIICYSWWFSTPLIIISQNENLPQHRGEHLKNHKRNLELCQFASASRARSAVSAISCGWLPWRPWPPLRNRGIGWMSNFFQIFRRKLHKNVPHQSPFSACVTLKHNYESTWEESLRCIWSIMKQQDLRSDLPLVSLQSFQPAAAVLKLQCHELNGHVLQKSGSSKPRASVQHGFEAHCVSEHDYPLLWTWNSWWFSISIIWIGGSPTFTKTLNVIPAVRYASLGITVWSSRRWSRALGRVKHLNSLELGILAALAIQFRSDQIMLKFTKPTVDGRNPKQPPGM